MEISLKTSILFLNVILTGLSAGFFYAWQVSVIPGNLKVNDLTFLQSMQSINRAILNPAFFMVFFGTLISLSITSIYEYHSSKWIFGLMLAASLTYIAGTFGVTALGNVPLNNELDALNLSDLSAQKAKEFRTYYETNWNRLHLIRTVFAVLSFILSVLAIFLQSSKS
ncbi:MAG: DUF1772 domain-containing protein [Ekhidna sp.]|nr:DUF1772 domain-containing protein [Ekhidna sp.]